ncbi:MAG: hypothetical protein Sapg2KO_26320 [Saprospiraceae bacterium]
MRETGILAEQQALMASQQEASVWPYLENNLDNIFKDDSIATFKLQITNKGVGPAIVGEDVTFFFDGETISHGELYLVIRERYPNLKVTQVQMSSFDKAVLAPGEVHTVITEQLTLPPGDTSSLNQIVNEINKLYDIKYCYCSVYGRCWKVKSIDETERSTECEFRADIR